ncbi:MAG: hypothetical protein KKF46_04840 [Nanoarchaeota archaeon]|nr:hypothetical protein [Nanoarchaeota archaeon]MBU1321659.1 hypothetical protein [Nanoarchaeota archaeon]MBU1596883.1 hypothetical protein [Nanoarchaeota archaeon]MBU2442328.1 hypothetical protein [Nanoarchaeota archaeon]
MFKKKSDSDSTKESKEIAILKKKVDNLEKEIARIEGFEKILAQQEIILFKKIRDMNQFEEDAKKLVSKTEFNELKKELNKVEIHEKVLFENSRYMQELVRELAKVKESHRLTRKQVLESKHVSKSQCEDRFGAIKEGLKDLENIRKTHKKKAGHNDLAGLKNELHDRLSQIEHQNKLLMAYLKKVDEILQKKE